MKDQRGRAEYASTITVSARCIFGTLRVRSQ